MGVRTSSIAAALVGLLLRPPPPEPDNGAFSRSDAAGLAPGLVFQGSSAAAGVTFAELACYWDCWGVCGSRQT